MSIGGDVPGILVGDLVDQSSQPINQTDAFAVVGEPTILLGIYPVAELSCDKDFGAVASFKRVAISHDHNPSVRREVSGAKGESNSGCEGEAGEIQRACGR